MHEGVRPQDGRWDHHEEHRVHQRLHMRGGTRPAVLDAIYVLFDVLSCIENDYAIDDIGYVREGAVCTCHLFWPSSQSKLLPQLLSRL